MASSTSRRAVYASLILGLGGAAAGFGALQMQQAGAMAGAHEHEAQGTDHHMSHAAMAANLDRSAIVWTNEAPLTPPELLATNDVPLAEQLEGRWSLLFFGFTSCPHVCPTTLGALARAANRPEDGLPEDTQVLFFTVDPEVDDRDRVTAYLAAFDERFLGYTGDAEALEGFADDVGAAFAPEGRTIDHSTSVFVVDPHGRPAGVLLRPTDVERTLRDLAHVRQQSTGVVVARHQHHGQGV